MSPTTTGARSASGKKRKPLGWLPWVLLLILALVIALVVLIVVNSDDDDDSAPVQAPATSLVVTLPAAAA